MRRVWMRREKRSGDGQTRRRGGGSEQVCKGCACVETGEGRADGIRGSFNTSSSLSSEADGLGRETGSVQEICEAAEERRAYLRAGVLIKRPHSGHGANRDVALGMRSVAGASDAEGAQRKGAEFEFRVRDLVRVGDVG